MKYFALSVALAALTAGSASAADLGARPYTKAPMASPIYDWTGLYIGANVGAAAAGTNLAPDRVDLFGNANGNNSNDLFKAGVTGGGQIGYNWQFAPNWVLGIEGDISAISGKRSTCDINDCGLNTELIFTSKTDYLATVRGRFGYAWDRSMVYVTGGAAFANVKDSLVDFGEPGAAHDDTLSGYAIGAGLETAIWSNWSLKAEYLYANVGTNRVDSIRNPGSYVDFKHEYQIGRVGLNYRFGGSGTNY
jgi:outer membrane immunogenic protein